MFNWCQFAANIWGNQHIFLQVFILLSMASGSNLAGKYHFAAVNSSTLPARKMFKLLFKGLHLRSLGVMTPKITQGVEIKNKLQKWATVMHMRTYYGCTNNEAILYYVTVPPTSLCYLGWYTRRVVLFVPFTPTYCPGGVGGRGGVETSRLTSPSAVLGSSDWSRSAVPGWLTGRPEL